MVRKLNETNEDDTKLVVDRIWKSNEIPCDAPLVIVKTHLVDEFTNKTIPNSVMYSVEESVPYSDEEFDYYPIECFKTLGEAKAFARNF